MVGYAPIKTDVSNDFQTNLAKIMNKGQFNEPMKLPPPPKPKTFDFAMGLPNAPAGPNINGGNFGPTGNTSLDVLMRAIAGQESGSSGYSALNKTSGAMGKYQIMPSNLTINNGSDWDRQALGRDITPAQFMASPQLQEAIARYKLGEYLKKWGAAGAAATWYGGTWGRQNMYSKKPQNGYPSMYEYVMAILRRAGSG